MAFPSTPGSSGRITKHDDGLWHCDMCEYGNAHYQAVIGHLGVHRSGTTKRTRDPLDLTITQLVDRVESLEEENRELRSRITKERQRTAAIRNALSAFMKEDR